MQQAQVKAVIEEQDEKQQLLSIEYTESVQVERDEPETHEPIKLPRGKKGKKRLKVQEKFDNIPVKKTTIIEPEEVKDNPEQWEAVSEVRTFEIIVEPTKLYKHEIIQKKYRSKTQPDEPLIMAKAPIRFSSSYVSASLATYICLNKYLEHSTLYRLEKNLLRLGADISRQTQSDAVEHLALWFRPIYEHIIQETLQSDYIQVDETFIKYINGKAEGVGQGYFWAYYNPGGYRVLKWITNRQHKNVPLLLKGFCGRLQSDGYAAYQKHASTCDSIILLACWAHAIRKFKEALAVEPTEAAIMCRLIKKLYELEADWNEQEVGTTERAGLRQSTSMPIVQEIKTKLDAYSIDMSIPNNNFKTAVNYTIGQWPALVQCLQHGDTRLDTNLLEGQFRAQKLGEKNWKWIGHPNAGEKSAIVYTIISCCLLHNINPHDYMTDVLEQIMPHDGRPDEQLVESLMPQKWALKQS